MTASSARATAQESGVFRPRTLGRWLLPMCAAASTALTSCAQPKVDGSVSQPLRSPNFLLIVADDMGYSDIGAYGGEIRTPNLDALSARGIRFSNFHVAPSCSPTRAMLLTGNDSHIAGLGGMAEALRPQQRGQLGYEGHLNQTVATIAERLREAGYFTAMTGKWHLGAQPDQIPAARGFDQSFALMNGAANYFGQDQGGALAGTLFAARYFEGTARSPLPGGAYTTDYFATRLVDFLDRNGREGNKPFFAYLAFNAPHTPLQAPDADILRYKGWYDAGPQALRTRRLKGLETKGIIAPDTKPATIVDAPDWQAMSAKDRAASARRMEVYAAAVDRLDTNVGRVLAALERNGVLNNTVIIFLSDNGAEGNDEDVWLDFLGKLGMPSETLDPMRVANRDPSRAGSGESYLAYGPAWAQAGMAPFSLTKSYVTEGGIRAPLVIAGPGVKGGRIVHDFAHVMDIVPTMLELAGLPANVTPDGKRAPQGLSLAPALSGNRIASRRITGWELFGRQAIRKGAWKAVYQNHPIVKAAAGAGQPRWALYNLERDPGETTDLSLSNPDALADLLKHWGTYARENGVIPVPQIGDPAGNPASTGARPPANTPPVRP